MSASNNTVSNFGNAAFVVQKSLHPADVYGNIVVSKNAQEKTLVIDGETGIVSDNRVTAAAEKPQE